MHTCTCIHAHAYIQRMYLRCYLSELDQKISFWCERRNINLEALHLLGSLNSLADQKSRSDCFNMLANS